MDASTSSVPFKRSPIVDDRGSASQWFAAAGLAYTF
jgi:outer membrane scaffolding protein for murein synthesis (MipA/OmpV family)